MAYARGKRSSPDVIAPWEHEYKTPMVSSTGSATAMEQWQSGNVRCELRRVTRVDGPAAKSLHPALKTIVPGSASFPGFGLPMQNNVFQSANYAWPFYVMDNRELDDAINNDSRRWTALNQKWYASGRPYREIDAIDGKPNPLLHRQMQHPSLDSYWQAMQPYRPDYARITYRYSR